MVPSAIALLCFGLCMGQWIKALEGKYLRPTLQAYPGPVVLHGTPVTLTCKGPFKATSYHLRKRESNFEDVNAPGTEAQFFISSVTRDTAGSYYCFYRIYFSLSEPSEPLELVATGQFGKPFLSVEPSQEVTSGQNVTFHCQLEEIFDSFVFYKETEANTSGLQDKGSQPHFIIPFVTTAHGGIYQCYVFHSQYPYLWSAPSDPLELKVTETQFGLKFSTPEAGSTNDAASRNYTTGILKDYTIGNLIRLSLTVLVLIFLGVLLVEAWHSWRRHHDEGLA